jgi:hypothetical protein
MCRRPAVSTISTSAKPRRASPRARSAMASGASSPLLARQVTPTSAASVASCWMAAGRYTSTLTTMTFFFSRSTR